MELMEFFHRIFSKHADSDSMSIGRTQKKQIHSNCQSWKRTSWAQKRTRHVVMIFGRLFI